MRLSSKIWKGLRSLPHIALVKVRHFNNFHCHYKQDIFLSAKICISDSGSMFLEESIHLKDGVELNVSESGILKIGKNVCINSNCNISSRGSVEIGAGTALGPGVIVVDHDHDFKNPEGLRGDTYIVEPVTIGKNVWIGANSIILKGTHIGDGSVIAAGSVVRGTFPENSIILQKRETTVRVYKRN